MTKENLVGFGEDSYILCHMISSHHLPPQSFRREIIQQVISIIKYIFQLRKPIVDLVIYGLCLSIQKYNLNSRLCYSFSGNHHSNCKANWTLQLHKSSKLQWLSQQWHPYCLGKYEVTLAKWEVYVRVWICGGSCQTGFYNRKQRFALLYNLIGRNRESFLWIK